ncbi:hypothetical protein [Streptomyces sp. PpalLS-921]|uniref:hypothetical protein n=1 Tax=Streptomyces sp. PpalLS-921 TaxID=1839772 RepID=UPI00081E7ABC|nr:hypothetical protein [Streptomyces sp. PpalLS-921]SCD61496.1 hypothetical protein GA0115249_106336 [Streptomyces sp. PpalLS-921]
MSDYDEMTTADVMSGEEMHEYDQAAEALLDAQDEARWAAEEAAAETRTAADPDDEPWDGLADGEER